MHFLLMSVVAIYFACAAQCELRTRYFGPVLKPAPGDHWMATAARQIGLRHQKPRSDIMACPKDGITDVTPCLAGEPLGMEDHSIPDGSITASSYDMWKANRAPWRGRLNIGGFVAAWLPDRSDLSNPWIEVNLSRSAYITGLITQGRGDFGCSSCSTQYVTEYQVMYADGEQSLGYATDGNGSVAKYTILDDGTLDGNNQTVNTFSQPFRANIIRILPTKWRTYCSLRLEIIGCYYQQ